MVVISVFQNKSEINKRPVVAAPQTTMPATSVPTSTATPYTVTIENYVGLEKKAAVENLKKLKDEGFTFFHFMIDLNQGPCVIKRITGCGAGNEYLAITPSGDIYPCHQFVGNEDFKLGNILEEKIELPQEVTNMFREAHVYAKDECRNCWNKFYCSGGCHANAINFNNDIKVPYKLGCEMQKKRTECAIMIQAKLMLEGN